MAPADGGEAGGGLSGEQTGRIGSFVRRVMREDGLPGVGVAVVEDGRTAYAGGFGSRDLSTNAPATADTLFGIGSCTKSFTALAVMQLADRGALSVDDPVSEHVPVDLGDGVTIHHLLTHSAGVPSSGMANVLLGRLTGCDGHGGVAMGDRADLHDHLEGAAGDRAAPPGEEFFYYAAGFTLLGEVIEAVTGRGYADYVTENVLDPLGMERSTFDREAFEAEGDAMTGYLETGDGFEARPYPMHGLLAPTGGLVAPVSELANYIAAQMNGGSFDGREVVSPGSARRMHDPHVDAGPGYGGYGYGWMVREFLGDTYVGHGGDAVVGTAALGFLDGVGVAVAANAAPGYGLDAVARGVLAAVAGRDPRGAVPLYARRRELDALTGEYESYRGIKRASVERAGGALLLRVAGIIGERTVPLFPAPDGDGLFHAVAASGERTPVRFVDDGEGVRLCHDRWVLRRVRD